MWTINRTTYEYSTPARIPAALIGLTLASLLGLGAGPALGGGYRGPSRLTSPRIDTSGYGALRIDFQRYLSAEMDDPDRDFLMFEAKASAGWQTIRHWGPESGADGGWHHEDITLTPADGDFFWSGFRVRFSYRGGGGGDYVGVDDVTVGAR